MSENEEREVMINGRLAASALTAVIAVSVPPADAQRLCDSPVSGVHDPSGVLLFVSGFRSGIEQFTPASVSHLNYHEMKNQLPGVFAGFRFADARVGREGEAERAVRVQYVTGYYFDVLEVRAHMGRVFFADEDKPEDKLAIAVISHQLWLSMFQQDPEVVGQSVNVNGRRITIVGVAPLDFHGVLQPSEETLWLPGASMPGANKRDSSEGYAHFIVRVGPDISWRRPGRDFGRLPAALAKAFPAVNEKFNGISFYEFGPLTCLSQ